MIKKKKIGLVLSGGATRMFAQIGVLKKICGYGFKPSIIAGCSAGSLIGVCLAAGKSIEEIEDFMLGQNPLNFLDVKMNKSGLIQGEKIVRRVLRFADVKKFEDLKIPLRVNATNINSGKEIVFDSGDLLSALNAAIAVPGIFVPKKINGELYSDGAILSPFPLHLIDECKFLVGIDVYHFHKKVTERTSAANIVAQAGYFMQRELTKYEYNLIEKEKTLLVFKPLVDSYNFFEYRKYKYKEMVYKGVKEAEKVLLSKKGKRFIKLFKRS